MDPQQEDFLRRALALLAEWDPALLENRQLLRARLNRLIAELDLQLSEQLSEIMHQPAFTELEAGWRNLKSLVTLPVNYQRARVKLLDISWQELSQDLNTCNTLRSSTLYNMIGNRELNTLGGLPFGMVVVNHDVSMEMGIDDDYDDLYTLELLGQLGSLCLCPFIMSPAEDFFGEIDAGWLSDVQRIEKILEGPDYTGWQRLREQTAARFIGLAMPKIRLRPAYRDRRIGFIFNERVGRRPGLWGSAAFAFASIALREFNRLGWFGFMKSRWQERYQGALINLPAAASSSQQSPLRNPQPNVRLFGNLAGFYAKQGFVPISHSPLTDKYYFNGNNSVWKPGPKDDDQVVCQLQTTLMICRIAHYLKVQIRSMIGNFHSAAECELFLSQWLDNYSSNVVSGDEDILARYPLKKGKVKVKEIDGSQGRYVCEVLVQPQYQFDHFFGEVLLTTDLAPPAAERVGN
ncbi:type VI secretion system contractile sheath domain-containing protein [Marinobacterium arenosum]|uniref:type VI secretion system contractile sheath domain-containing protein n=1 Tax=Marinobacterium arenosum TaxID=2862496 RepID=UPI002104DD32|nr:type VI secretion system contractile sheath large subunit [Marinobacterium arenosum]